MYVLHCRLKNKNIVGHHLVGIQEIGPFFKFLSINLEANNLQAFVCPRHEILHMSYVVRIYEQKVRKL